ncbi:MAG: tetratricopeptide repeat protein [Vampirovibrionales bacterium]|nr:tetratricopeptide repeat protein [Vampirovibrionales bacterium]
MTKIEGFLLHDKCTIIILGAVAFLTLALPMASAQTPVSIRALENKQVIGQSVYYALDEASELIGQKRYADAILVLNRTVEKDPINIFSHYNLGFCYLELAKIAESSPPAIDHQNRYVTLLKKSEFHFQRVQQLNPDLSVSYFKLGKIALMRDDLNAAEAYYREGMAVDPENAPLAFNLGRVYDQAGKNQKAIAEYKRAISLDPSFVYAYNNLGLLYEGQKQYTLAEKAYQAALKQDIGYNYARLNLGNLYAELGRLSDAQRQYEGVLLREPKNSWAYLYLGNVHFLSGHYEEATTAYKASITINPEFATAYYLLAVSLSKLNRIDEALSASLHYMNLEPEGKYSEQLRNLIAILKIQKSMLPANLSSKSQAIAP